MYPSSVRQLIDSFKNLPGIGEKSAERLAFSMVNFDKETLTNFSNAIVNVRDLVSTCKICGNISEGDICSICSNEDRNNGMIFVVEKPKDIFLFEKLGVYKGRYHVLGGLLSPLEGIGPDDINLKSLLERVRDGKVKEVISRMTKKTKLIIVIVACVVILAVTATLLGVFLPPLFRENSPEAPRCLRPLLRRWMTSNAWPKNSMYTPICAPMRIPEILKTAPDRTALKLNSPKFPA